MISINETGTFMADVAGVQPTSPKVNDLDVRIAYLGDVASSSGASGSLPNLMVDPDGFINFQDQMIFALGFNGAGSIRDRISDIGPVTGTAPTSSRCPMVSGTWTTSSPSPRCSRGEPRSASAVPPVSTGTRRAAP
ncbi:MAG: hypothetical protein R3E12_10015 [Candidatus Eisenbacteria bacterium]